MIIFCPFCFMRNSRVDDVKDGKTWYECMACGKRFIHGDDGSYYDGDTDAYVGNEKFLWENQPY